MSNQSENTLYAPVVVEVFKKLEKQIEFYKSLLNTRETELKEVHQYLWDCNELYYKDMANVSARFIHSLTKEHIDIFFHCYIPLQHIASDDYNGELAAYRDVAIRWKYLENEAYNNLYKEHPELLDDKFWILSSANILNEDEFMSEEDINELYLGSPEDWDDETSGDIAINAKDFGIWYREHNKNISLKDDKG